MNIKVQAVRDEMLLQALLTVKELALEGKIDKSSGICYNVAMEYDKLVDLKRYMTYSSDIYEVLNQLFADWHLHSGNRSYPIPKLKPRHCYRGFVNVKDDKLPNLWSKKSYYRLRMDLLEHTINKLKMRMSP